MRSNHPSTLDTWDELTRGIRPPKFRSQAGVSIHLGAVAIAAVVLAVLALGPLVGILAPGNSVKSMAPSAAEASPTPGTSPKADRIRLHLVSIRDVSLDPDLHTVHVSFDAGTCADGYQGTARVVIGVLEIGIYEVANPKPRPTANASSDLVVCAGVGTIESLTLSLEEPFSGHEVRDLYGQILWLAPPPWLAIVGAVPNGWELRRQGNVLGTDRARWERVFSPLKHPKTEEGDPMFTLIQSAGGPVSVTGGVDVVRVEVNGQPATLALDRFPFGTEMVLVWSVGDNGFALIGNDRNLTRHQFLTIADSVVLPTSAPPS